MAAKARLLFTRNFASNLDSIEQFLGREGGSAFKRLLDRILDEICPLLAQFPLSGYSFLGRRVGSAEGRALLKRLRGMLRAGDDVREFAVDDYVALYLVRGSRLYFLAIKHHRQLSFDLGRHWG